MRRMGGHVWIFSEVFQRRLLITVEASFALDPWGKVQDADASLPQLSKVLRSLRLRSHCQVDIDLMHR